MVTIKTKGEDSFQLENPCIIYDKSTKTLLKIGELEEMHEVASYLKERYSKAKLQDLISNLVVMELPKDEVEITKILKEFDAI